MWQIQERSAKLCLHVVILIRTTALLKKFDRHNDHHLSNVRQNINEHVGSIYKKNQKRNQFIWDILIQVIFFVKE
jgi:hypothetical protein